MHLYTGHMTTLPSSYWCHCQCIPFRTTVPSAIHAGCTWDERMISGLRLALQFSRPVVLVHCVQSCPYPQSEEWPEDLRPFFSSQQPIKYVSQYFGVCTRLIMDMLDGKPINTEALGRPVLPGIDPVSPLVDPASKYVHLVTAKSDVERLVQAFAAASAAAQPPTAAPLSAFQAQAQIPDASSSSPGPSTSSAEARRAAAEKGPRAIRVPSATDESDAAASPATRTRSSSTGDSSCTGEGEGVNALDTNLEEVAVTMAPSPLAMQPLEPTESNVSALMPDAVAAVVAAAAAASGSGPHVLLGYAHDGWLPSVAVLQRQLEPQCSIHTQRVGRHSRAVAAAAAQANCTVASSNGGMLPVSEHPSMAANNSHVSSKAQLPVVLAVSSQVPNDASVSMQAAVNGLPPGAVQQGNQCSEAIATGAVLPVHNQAGPQQQQQSQNHALNQNQQPGKGTYVHFLSPSLRVLDGCFRAVLAAQESGLHVVLVCDASAGQHLQERPAHVDRAVWKVGIVHFSIQLFSASL